MVKIIKDMFSGVDRILALACQTDRWRDIVRQHSLRYAYASCGKIDIFV